MDRTAGYHCEWWGADDICYYDYLSWRVMIPENFTSMSALNIDAINFLPSFLLMLS